jgi:hypothetical protein
MEIHTCSNAVKRWASELFTKKLPDKIAKPNSENEAQNKSTLWDYFDNVSKLLGGIAFVCWMIQEWVLPHNRIFLFIAILFGLADIFYLVLHKFLPRNRFLVILGWTMFFALMFYITKHEDRDRKPLLKLIIVSAQPTNPLLALTNDFLVWAVEPYDTNAHGCVVVPTPKGQSNVIVAFGISNTDRHETYTDVQVTLALSSRIRAFPSKDWSPIRPWADGRGGFTFSFPRALHATEYTLLPPIKFMNTESPEFVTAVIKANGMDTFGVVFWLHVGNFDLQNPIVATINTTRGKSVNGKDALIWEIKGLTTH